MPNGQRRRIYAALHTRVRNYTACNSTWSHDRITHDITYSHYITTLHMAMGLAQIKTSTDGRNYILVVVDLCKRFIWLYAIADKASDSLNTSLRELCAICGKTIRI